MLLSIPEISFYAMWSEPADDHLWEVVNSYGSCGFFSAVVRLYEPALRHEPFTNAEMLDSNVVSIVASGSAVETSFQGELFRMACQSKSQFDLCIEFR